MTLDQIISNLSEEELLKLKAYLNNIPGNDFDFDKVPLRGQPGYFEKVPVTSHYIHFEILRKLSYKLNDLPYHASWYEDQYRDGNMLDIQKMVDKTYNELLSGINNEIQKIISDRPCKTQ